MTNADGQQQTGTYVATRMRQVVQVRRGYVFFTGRQHYRGPCTIPLSPEHKDVKSQLHKVEIVSVPDGEERLSDPTEARTSVSTGSGESPRNADPNVKPATGQPGGPGSAEEKVAASILGDARDKIDFEKGSVSDPYEGEPIDDDEDTDGKDV